MGQIIAFPLPPACYPDLATDLELAEHVLLLAIRWWVAAFRNGEDPISRLRPGLESAGAADVAPSVDGLMTVVARAVVRPVDIHCPGCPRLSRDEAHLLQAASLMQAGDRRLTEKVLRTTLLSAQGVEFALGPLEGIGVLLARARLLLSHRRLAGDGPMAGDVREGWSPQSIH
jgi:hypothetical protein